MGIPKVDEATTIALEVIRDAAPGLLTVTEVAEKVAENAGVSAGTARSRVRAAIEAGGLLELKPWSRKFIIDLPGEEDAGVGPFYIAMEWVDGVRRKFITTDDSTTRPSGYGPGNTTYVADPEQIREYVLQLADEKRAKKKAQEEAERAEYAARQDQEKVERKEIARRFPGLRRLLRRLEFVGDDTREGFSRTMLLEAETRLSGRRDDVDLTEKRAHLDIRAWGDVNVAIMQSILEAGIAAHLADQPLTLCKHCGWRVLRTTGDRQWWWHVETTNASCGKDTDTKAEPVDVPRETSEDGS